MLKARLTFNTKIHGKFKVLYCFIFAAVFVYRSYYPVHISSGASQKNCHNVLYFFREETTSSLRFHRSVITIFEASYDTPHRRLRHFSGIFQVLGGSLCRKHCSCRLVEDLQNIMSITVKIHRYP